MNKKMSPLLLLSVIGLLSVGVGCNDDEKRADSFQQKQIVPGTYTSQRCFMNKIETQTAMANRYSQAQLTFNADGTGSGHYSIYNDAACATVTGDQNFTFSSVTLVDIGGASVIRLQQSGTVVNPTWWIPANLSDGGYSLDTDFTDGESGAYLFEPTPTQLTSFMQNPGQGVAYKKQ